MASIVYFLSFILFLALFFPGNASNCLKGKKLEIRQSKTGNWAHGMPEMKVRMINRCECAVAEVKLNCTAFQTYKTEDPSLLTISGDVCLLKNGAPIPTNQHVQFLYAWDPPFPFKPISFKELCN
ncbi:hypothetical protein PHAVU_008G024700 [Phaseolus vulgaris]|uniref:Uncharacterized protein n=1 Tax=Phaseolus vulgaris TaxID=3885 RepID=V7B4I8_PHAVU|nr:hypothetical protein PHAVU_008G024700g [Phaseolus vulgaris]ESW11376.1 hypothetical protein PHAVU_008G024700g [Phaseolus vulgaris]